jgi:hypothetical protein
LPKGGEIAEMQKTREAGEAKFTETPAGSGSFLKKPAIINSWRHRGIFRILA